MMLLGLGIAQEGIQTVKTKIPAANMKIDLSKGCDKVKWFFLRLLLQMGMNLITVSWIMGCLSSLSFAVLINDSPSDFFDASRGLRQGCSISPFIFLIVAEGLTMLIKEARRLHDLYTYALHG